MSPVVLQSANILVSLHPLAVILHESATRLARFESLAALAVRAFSIAGQRGRPDLDAVWLRAAISPSGRRQYSAVVTLDGAAVPGSDFSGTGNYLDLRLQTE